MANKTINRQLTEFLNALINKKKLKIQKIFLNYLKVQMLLYEFNDT